MKRFTFIAFAAALLGLAACSVEEVTVAPEADEISTPGFTIKATIPNTKTTVNEYRVSWEEGDNMSILINNGEKDQLYKFVWTGTGDDFSSTKFNPSADSSYTWRALYPYQSKFTGLDGDYSSAYVNVPTKSGLTQAAAGDMSHLANMPLYSYAETDGTEEVELKMHHLTSIIQVSLTNNLSEDLDLFTIDVDNTSGALFSGTFYVNCEDGSLLSSGANYTFTNATLAITDGTVKAGETGVFYIPVATSTIAAGKDIVFTIKDNNKGTATITKTMSSALTFNPGRYRNTRITIDGNTEFVADNPIEEVTVAEFLAKAVDADTYYRLTGTVSNIKSTQYGNFDLVDETGTVYVYGLTREKVATNDQSFASLGIEEGDILTLEGTRAEYKGTAQVGGPAYFISLVKPATLVVDPETLVFEAGGGSKTITATTKNFAGDVTITAESDDPQFTVSVSGNTVTVTAGENTGDDAIPGTITITATDGTSTKTATVTVSQEMAGQPVLLYTLDGSDATQGSNGYATDSDITQDDVSWKVTANTTIDPWRFGGKSITNTNRAAYSTSAIAGNVTRIEVTSGTANATVNSLTISVHNSAEDAESGSNAIASKTVSSDIAGSTVTLTKSDETSWAGKYYRIVYNITVSGSSNKYVQFISAEFYGFN